MKNSLRMADFGVRLSWCVLLVMVSVSAPLFAQAKPEKVTSNSDSRPPETQKPTRLELLKTFDSEFVRITPGKGKFPSKFQMGSNEDAIAVEFRLQKKNERPAHDVVMKRPFAIARYETTQNLYEAVMGVNPSQWKGPRNSVEMVSWKDATRFCGRATELMRHQKLIDSDIVIRLPTEAEWEYSCRAGTTTRYSFGDRATRQGDLGNTASFLDPYAWHTGNAAGNDPAVGSLKPNPWGLYDVHGYLWEYVQDGYQPDYSKTPRDGSAATGTVKRDGNTDSDANRARVIRGGSWQGPHWTLTSSSRMKVLDTVMGPGIGFRCVKARVQSIR